MAVGDAYVVAPTSLADDAFLALQPAGSTEVVIHNIFTPQAAAYELYWYDGANSVLFDAATVGRGSIYVHCTNSIYIRVKNVSGGTAYFGADGVYTA